MAESQGKSHSEVEGDRRQNPGINQGAKGTSNQRWRQEEAQRLGRILRPKKKEARFYTLVTLDSKEQDFAMKRQLFLTEQGYRYLIQDCAALLSS